MNTTTKPRARKTKTAAAAASFTHDSEQPVNAASWYEDLHVSRVEVVSMVASLFTGIVTTTVLVAITESLAVAAYAYSGWLFLSFVILALGWAMALVAALTLASRVAKYIAQGKAEDDLHRARSWVYDKWHRFTGKSVSLRSPITVH